VVSVLSITYVKPAASVYSGQSYLKTFQGKLESFHFKRLKDVIMHIGGAKHGKRQIVIMACYYCFISPAKYLLNS
jgi:hypothetical protein